MISIGWVFVIFSTLLLCGGVAGTVLWFRQAGARLEAAGEKPRVSKGEQRGL